MKFREKLIPKTKGELRDSISDAMLRAPTRQFPNWEDFDGVFHSMACGVDNLRKRIGDARAEQLLEMLVQSKTHYEAGDNKLAGALMEDAKMVIMNRRPWAYPKELYRWARDEALPELSEADVMNKEIEGD